MSFLSVLQSINSVFTTKINPVVTSLEPAIGAIPVYGPAFDAIFNTVVAVESLFAGLGGATTGVAKKTVATTVLAAVAPAIPAATVSSTIDEIVAALNALQAVQAKVSVPAPVV